MGVGDLVFRRAVVFWQLVVGRAVGKLDGEGCVNFDCKDTPQENVMHTDGDGR